MRSRQYSPDVLVNGPQRRRKREVPQVAAERGLVVEDIAAEFCGAVIFCEKDAVTLEDRHGKRRVFPLRPAPFLLDGKPVMLVRPGPQAGPNGHGGPDGQGGHGGPGGQGGRPARTASGSVAAPPSRAKVA